MKQGEKIYINIDSTQIQNQLKNDRIPQLFMMKIQKGAFGQSDIVIDLEQAKVVEGEQFWLATYIDLHQEVIQLNISSRYYILNNFHKDLEFKVGNCNMVCSYQELDPIPFYESFERMSISLKDEGQYQINANFERARQFQFKNYTG